MLGVTRLLVPVVLAIAAAIPAAAQQERGETSPTPSLVQSREATPPRSPASGGDFACSGKRLCREMASCAEAVFNLRRCGAAQLDRDGDGIPCESICR